MHSFGIFTSVVKIFEFHNKYIVRCLLLKYQLTFLLVLLYLTRLKVKFIKILSCISKEDTYLTKCKRSWFCLFHSPLPLPLPIQILFRFSHNHIAYIQLNHCSSVPSRLAYHKHAMPACSTASQATISLSIWYYS